MSAVTESADHATDAAAHDHPSDLSFIKIAGILALITALETSTYWWPDGAHNVAMAVLLICMVIKFVMILLYFMHLKWDSKLFSLLFYIGVVLAVGVYMVALFTFKFFG